MQVYACERTVNLHRSEKRGSSSKPSYRTKHSEQSLVQASTCRASEAASAVK